MGQTGAATLVDPRLQALRSVAAALNALLPEDVVDRPKGLDAGTTRSRYYPNYRLLIVTGASQEHDEGAAVAQRLLDQALIELSPAARRECRGAAVAWLEHEHGRGAAFELAAQGGSRLIAASWEPRHLWSTPMPDPGQTPAAALQEAIELVRTEMTGGLEGEGSNRTAVTGALRLCEACFRWARGIPPSTSQSLPAEVAAWKSWLSDYLRAAGAEQRRLFPDLSLPESRRTAPPLGGVLAGTRVFLSYAMPTNVEFARPLRRALEQNGALVWFDQAKHPDHAELKRGLQKEIADCDVFLLCASAELFENAGYALQELAWAFDMWAADSWKGGICAAQLDDVRLPRAFAEVPHVDLSGLDEERWPALIVELVARARASRTIGKPVFSPRPAPREPGSFRLFETPALLLRGLHARAWSTFDLDSATRDLAEHQLDGSSSPGFGALTRAIAPLEWDGKLASYDTWPDDPAVRDTRMRIGTLRCLFLCRTLKLDPSLMSVEQLGAEITFLALRRAPMLDERSVAGWDDEARRWSVRHHLGALNRLAELLMRGLAVGVLAFSERQRELWADAVEERRYDCADSLFDLRRAGRVRWDGCRAAGWDSAYAAVDAFLFEGGDQWDRQVPSWVQLGLLGARLEVAALAAEVIWRCSRTHLVETRSATTRGSTPSPLEVRAKLDDGEPTKPDLSAQRIVLEAKITRDATVELELVWSDGGTAKGWAKASRALKV